MSKKKQSLIQASIRKPNLAVKDEAQFSLKTTVKEQLGCAILFYFLTTKSK